MKNILNRLSALVLISLLFSLSASAQCEDKKIAKACKPNIKPYKYDAYAVTDIKFDAKPKTVEVQFTVYEGQEYKLVFCSSGFPEGMKLSIYDKSKAVKSRKKIFEGEQGKINGSTWSYEPNKTGTYYIEYEVPAANDGKTRKECVVLLIGFK